MLTRDDYQAAVDVQYACNMSAVVFIFAGIMQRMIDSGMDIRVRNQHPITQLFCDRMVELARVGDWPAYTEANDAVLAYLKESTND